MDTANQRYRTTTARREDGSRSWYVSRHEDCRAVLRDRRLSLEPADLGVEIVRERSELQSRLLALWSADQIRIRRLMDRVAGEVLTDLVAERTTFNVKWDFAIPVANRVFVEVLGLPARDVDLIREWFRNNSAGNAHHSARGFRGIARYLARQVELKLSGHGGDDLLTGLLAAVDRSAPRPRVVANLAWLILGLGWDLAHPIVSTGVLLLLTNADRRALVAADPGLFTAAVDEVFRLFDPTPTFQETDSAADVGQPLYAKEDTSLGDLTIRKGDVVHVDLGKANRDPTVFEAPDQLVVGRPAGRIAWEVPGTVFPAVVFVRPQVEACLSALFSGDRRLELDDPGQVGLLEQPMRLRWEGLTVSSVPLGQPHQPPAPEPSP